VRGAVGSSVKILATLVPMAEMCKLDLLPVSLFRDEEDMRVSWRRQSSEDEAGVS